MVICNGMAKEAIKTILSGRKIGTFFTDSANVGTVPTEIIAENGINTTITNNPRKLTSNLLARIGGRLLQTLTPDQRASCVHTLADLLVNKQSIILDANQKDLQEAASSGVAKPLLSRLSLTPSKLKNLAVGLKQIADSSHRNVGRVLRRTR